MQLQAQAEGLAVWPTGAQDSHRLATLAQADALALLPGDAHGAATGEYVDTYLLRALECA